MLSVKLKIVYVLTAGGVGGAQRYVRDLAASLPKDRFEAKIFSGGENLRWLSNRISPFFLMNDWFALFELAGMFRREQPNIIHLNSSKAGVLGPLAAFLYNSVMRPFGTPRARVVFTAHGWVMNPANHPSKLARWVFTLLHRTAAALTDTIINVSEADYEIAVRYRIAPPQKLCTIHNGIDSNIQFLDKQTSRKKILQKLEIGNCPAEPDPALPEKLEINSSGPWIGSIGRLTKEKDYPTLIRAAEKIPNAKFFIVGEGPELENLKLMVENLKLSNRIFFVPPTGNDAQFLKAFDAFALSSIKEGLPYTLLEAMAAGVPVAATRAGGIPEVVRDGVNGTLAPVGDPEKLSGAIARLLGASEFAERLAQQARVDVQKRFSIAAMVQATERVYEAKA